MSLTIDTDTNIIENKIETISKDIIYNKCDRYTFEYNNSSDTSHSEYFITFKENCVIDVLIIGGGGGGGYNCGGGGGGGEVIHHQNYIPELHKKYVIKVGKGGSGATNTQDPDKDLLKKYYGNNGENSSFGNKGDGYDYSMAKGGGGGAGLDIIIDNIIAKNINNKDFSGEWGGSGGGSYAFQYYEDDSENYYKFANTNKKSAPLARETYIIDTYGNNGGYSKNLSIDDDSTISNIAALGGGGGGAGSDGVNSIIHIPAMLSGETGPSAASVEGVNNGNGGDGIQLDNCPMDDNIARDCDIDNINNLSSTNTKYWAAGGGGGSLKIANGNGGNGGGGNGGMDTNGVDATQHTGSGGGGGGWKKNGGNGGSGIVIVLVRKDYNIKIPKLIKDYNNYNAIFKSNLDTFLKKHYMYDNFIKINQNYIDEILNSNINKDEFIFYNVNGNKNTTYDTNIKTYDILFNLTKGLINNKDNIDNINTIIINDSVSCTTQDIFCFDGGNFKLKYDVADINIDLSVRDSVISDTELINDSIKKYIYLLLNDTNRIDKTKLIVFWVYISHIHILSEFRKNAEKILLNLLYLKWKDVGDAQPSGTEITNVALKTHLTDGKRLFTRSEFDSFFESPGDITHDNWIISNNKYYKPVNICEEISDNILEYYSTYSDNNISTYVNYNLAALQSIQTDGYILNSVSLISNIITISDSNNIDILDKIDIKSLKNKFKIKDTSEDNEYDITTIIKNSDNYYEITLDNEPTVDSTTFKIVPKKMKIDDETYKEKRQNLNNIDKNIKNNKHELEKINDIYTKYKKQFDLINLKSNIYYFIIGIISILIIVLFAFNVNNEIKSILLIIGILILLILYIYNYFTSFSKDVIEQFNSDSNDNDKYDTIDYKCLYNEFTKNNNDNGCRKDASSCNSDRTPGPEDTCETRLKLIYIIRNNLFNKINDRWIDINKYIDYIDKKYIYDRWIDMDKVLDKEEQTYKNYNEFYNLKKKKNNNINNIYINKIFFQSNFINMILMIYLIIFILLLLINLFPDNIGIILFLGIILLAINIYIYIVKVKQPTRNNIIYKYWNKPSLN